VQVEIERKFLVSEEKWKNLRPTLGQGCSLRQGYLHIGRECVVRVRVAGAHGWLTIKGNRTGATRAEFEYRIPEADAEILIATACGNRVIEKTRYVTRYQGTEWTVDQFHGPHNGLLLAEVELTDERAALDIPPWATREVTDDERFYNQYLASHA
jgi:CYTH domain-containing protein